jgi:hypothetical protein
MEAATGVAMAVATGVAGITGRTSRAGGARLTQSEAEASASFSWAASHCA